MKFYSIIASLAAILCVVAAERSCKMPAADVPKGWITMLDECTKKMKDQVQIELKAAIMYMAMGAHFSRDSINRPGFADLFFKSASEEREHAMKIIQYLTMRGGLVRDFNELIPYNTIVNPPKSTWGSGYEALKDALNLEAEVTERIKLIMQVCEQPKDIKSSPPTTSSVYNDYHLVDYLTTDFLDEQYKGQRDLAGKMSTLGKMMKSHAELGEFLFDKKLLAGEL